MNYFELFNLQPAPVVNVKSLSTQYFTLQRKYHPDFYSNAGEAEKEEALQQSAAINKAYKIFQDPALTLEYFLQQEGVVEHDEKYALPPAFLMEMMELNEQLDEGATAGALENVKSLEAALDKEYSVLMDKYIPGDKSYLQQMKAYYYKKKYLNRILDRLAD